MHPPPPSAAPHSTISLRIFAAMAMAATAMSIDSILPAFADIRAELGLAADSSQTAGLITAFFIGLAIGQIPVGIAADRFGRRPVLIGAAVVFLTGIAMMSFSTSLAGMFVARVVWGLGSAGLRIGALAMIRDRFVGARMAKEMAFVMAVFLVVPIIAPSLAAGVIKILPWRAVLGLSALLAVGLIVATLRMPETLDRSARQPLRLAQVLTAARAIAGNRISLRFTLLQTAIFGVFSSYLASSERIIDDVFHRKSQFPVLFGMVGVLMGATSVMVGRNVERIGLNRVIRIAVLGFVVSTTSAAAIAVAFDGVPPFWLFWVMLTCSLILHNVVFPNTNTAAMIPLGHIAGTASAIIGTTATAVGSVIGAVIDRAYNGTVTPLAVAFVVAAVIAAVLALPITGQTAHVVTPAHVVGDPS